MTIHKIFDDVHFFLILNPLFCSLFSASRVLKMYKNCKKCSKLFFIKFSYLMPLWTVNDDFRSFVVLIRCTFFLLVLFPWSESTNKSPKLFKIIFLNIFSPHDSPEDFRWFFVLSQPQSMLALARCTCFVSWKWIKMIKFAKINIYENFSPHFATTRS
jgi:hypothetical protein